MSELYLQDVESLQRTPKYKLYELIEKQLNHMDCTPLNVFEIKNYIYYGFSNEYLRPQYWRVILGYHCKNKFNSANYYSKARNSYSLIEISASDKFIDMINKDILRTKLLLPNTGYVEYIDSIKTILLKFVSTNSSIGYVQGMIDLVFPIYHVMATSKDLDIQKYAEEDSFYMFNSLMSEINDCFHKSFDNCKNGIKGKIGAVFDIIFEKDQEIYYDMLDKGLLDTDFPMKWIVQLFSTVFTLDDSIWLWDKILSDSSRFEVLNYLCAATILLLKPLILKNTFDKCMIILQNPSVIDVKMIFSLADELRRSNKVFEEVFAEQTQSIV